MPHGGAGSAFGDLSLFRAAASRLGVNLSALQLERFQHYGELLLTWNERMNLTAITAPTAIQNLHFLDALTLVPVVRGWRRASGMAAPTLLDVGSGAGMPGFALKVALPELQVTLLDGTGKRVKFLQRAIDDLELEGIGAVQGRAETLAHDPEWREWFDLVTARALARLPLLLEWCLPLARVGGLVLAPKAGDIASELADGCRAAGELGGSVRPPIAITAPELPNRLIVAIDKSRRTPALYPRPAGQPRRNPLGVTPLTEIRRASPGSAD